MRTKLLRVALLLLALATMGCGKRDSGTQQAGSGSAVAVPVKPSSVDVYINDEKIVTVQMAQLTSWPRLDTLVPEADRRLGTWVKVELVGAKTTELQHPSAAYPDKVPALFPGESGTISFGMFDPVEHAKKGPPGLRADDIHEIRITLSTEGRSGDHQGGAVEDFDPSKLVLAFDTPAGKKQLTGTEIIALPREELNGQQGWKLSALLSAAGIKAYQHLILIDATGTSLVIDKADFDDITKVPFVKLNKQGQLRFRLMAKIGDGWQASGDLRALASVTVK